MLKWAEWRVHNKEPYMDIPFVTEWFARKLQIFRKHRSGHSSIYTKLGKFFSMKIPTYFMGYSMESTSSSS